MSRVGMTFTLQIELGNEAMNNPLDVAVALRNIAKRLESDDMGGDPTEATGNVRDSNGNHVGEWIYTNEDAESDDLSDECSRCGAAPHEP